MPVFPLILQQTYRTNGFFNVTVAYDDYVRQDDGPVEIVLVSNGIERQIDGRVSRAAQDNKTARIYGNAPLRNWFQEHYRVGDRVDVDIRAPDRLRIVVPGG